MTIEKDKVNKRQIYQDEETLNSFVHFFHSFEGTTNYAYNQALVALAKVEKTAETPRKLMEYLMEDIIFTALYTTIYEELFLTLKQHPDVAIRLLDKFADGQSDRDQLVNIHTQNHMNYIMHDGECSGCSSCEGHSDLTPLLVHWHKANLEYFVKLYLEVQTIHSGLERILYDLIPTHPDYIDRINDSIISQFRQYIAQVVTNKLHQV
ncbi:MAG: hypothetical protein HYV97_06495 [Bdellovibrio sp.]|nr:hypothetical protein [Bdellovibrio sp.]